MWAKYRTGTIEVITGPMFSGKTDELIKRVKMLSFAKIKVLVFKPSKDTRWSTNQAISRSGAKIDVIAIKDSSEILKHWNPEYKVVAIDEAQFFDEGLIKVISQLASSRVRVIVSALDQDYSMRPFGIVPSLLAIAERVKKFTSICTKCGAAATTTARIVNQSDTMLIGDAETYEPRCRMHHPETKNLKL